MSLPRRLSLTVVAAAVAVVASSVVVPSAQASSGGSFVSLVNSARSSAGLAPYAVASDLTAVAQGQAQRMASSQKLFHNPYLASQVRNWRYVGENVGYGPDVNTLMSAFLHSPAHLANILDHDYTQIGVGTVTVNGTMWVSMVFRDPMSSGPSPKPTAHTSTAHAVQRGSAGRGSSPGHPVRGKAKRSAKVVALVSFSLPDGVVCSAAPMMTARIRDLTDLTALDRTVRQVEQSQLLLQGFQCGRSLPMTGVFDAATLQALSQA